MARLREATAALIVGAVVGLPACGSGVTTDSGRTRRASSSSGVASLGLRSHPQAVEPSVGDPPSGSAAVTPVGDPNAHAIPLGEVRRELQVVRELNSLSPGQGFVSPIQPGRRVWLYPGIQEPSVSMASRGPEEVPQDLWSRLVATFNSGFKLADSGGGFAIGGHTYAPLKDGLATIMRFRNGRADVRGWTGSGTAPPDVVYARQNLPLIIDHAYPAPRRCSSSHGARHQHLLDELHHLPPSRRHRSGEPARRHGPLTTALPDAR